MITGSPSAESRSLLYLFEQLPCHGNPLPEAGTFELVHHGFKNRRYVDVLRALVNALTALHAEGRELGLAEGNCTAQPCSVHEFLLIGIFDHGEVVELLETERDVYTGRTGHAVPAA